MKNINKMLGRLKEIPFHLLDEKTSGFLVNVTLATMTAGHHYDLDYKVKLEKIEWLEVFGVVNAIMNRRNPDIPVKFSLEVVMYITLICGGNLVMVNFYALYATEKAIRMHKEEVNIQDLSMYIFPGGIWDKDDPEFNTIWDDFKLTKGEQERKGLLSSDDWLNYLEFWKPLLEDSEV